jgi:hypothetical protein
MSATGNNMTPEDEAALQALWNDPARLLDEIDSALDSHEIGELPIWSLSDEEDDSPYREIEEGRPTHRVLDRILALHRDAMKEWACVKFGYCAAKTRHGETIALAKAVCDGMVSVWVKVPLPVATIGCYCVQSLYLDKLCECHSSAPA